jgi:hypothetical protein
LEIKGFVAQLSLQRIQAMEIAMLYQTRKKPLLARWLTRAVAPFRRRRVTDVSELSPYLRADIGLCDSYDPTFR